MVEKNYTGIIPDQQKGVAIDTGSSIELDSEEKARHFYKVAKNRLLDVNNWHAIAGAGTAEFQLTNAAGERVNGLAAEGLFFRINIPGPSNSKGDGYDWVQIEAVEDFSEQLTESIGVRVRPASSPVNDEKDVAHFYDASSTSCFTITREGTRITAAIYDRNTRPNLKSEGVTEKIRDAIVGAIGVIGFSKFQWKSLADGLLKTED